MFDRFKKKKIATTKELQALGLQLMHRHLTGFTDNLTFESPAAITSTTYHGECSIGYLSYFRQRSMISHTDIGRFCCIAPNVFTGGGEHPTDWLSTHNFQYGGGTAFKGRSEFHSLTGETKFNQPKGRVCIRNDIWIGEGANISRGVTIGDGAIVAAKSVVTKDVPPYAIVAGVPASIMRFRFTDDIIEQLCRLTWWNYDLAPLARIIDYSDIHKAIELIGNSIETRKIKPLTPKKYTLTLSAGSHYIK
ncbi:MAG: CatB-related O-acetyltransferase [Deltaproteobacteria bacterium]|nr:CatB-related O-acetyltransferase [Deltaproteobacteria bacterium]